MNDMKKKSIRIALLAGILLAGGHQAVAQTSNSAYFLNGSTFRHELNPSFINERSYVSFPMLGNININVQTNSGVGDFLFVRPDGTLTTFLSDEVSRNQFLNGLPGKSKLGLDLDLSVFSLGFESFGGFNTIGISLRSMSDMAVPREFFSFMKDGLGNDAANYRIKNMNVSLTDYVELALGHAREINDQWTVGAKMKFLVGLVKADFLVKDMQITATPDHWSIKPNNVSGYISAGGIRLKTKGELGNYTDDDYVKDESGNPTDQLKEGAEDRVSFEDIDFSSIGPSGFGLGFDLGATYKLNDDWSFSAAVLDLGFVSWSNTNHLAMNNSFEFNGFENITFDDEGNANSFDNQVNKIQEDLLDLAQFTHEGVSSRSTALAATLNLGAQYTLPVYNRLTFGALSSTRIQGANSWTEMRISANVSPIDWFEASVNYGLSNFGSDMGIMLNIHPRYFNIYLAAGIPLAHFEPAYFAPIGRANLNLNFGIAIPFGTKE